MSELKSKITDALYAWMLSFVTTENVQRLLLVVCDKLNEKAIQTENKIDDVMIDTFRSIASNTDKVKVITDYLVSVLKNPKECKAEQQGFVPLAEQVACAGESKEVSGVPVLLIAKLLELTLPYIIEYFMKKE